MKIAEIYSHLNGLEYLLVHKKQLWKELQKVISSVDAEKCKTKISRERTMEGKALYSPVEMNKEFKKLLNQKEWKESKVYYWVTKNEGSFIKLLRDTLVSRGYQRLSEGCKSGFLFSFGLISVF